MTNTATAGGTAAQAAAAAPTQQGTEATAAQTAAADQAAAAAAAAAGQQQGTQAPAAVDVSTLPAEVQATFSSLPAEAQATLLAHLTTREGEIQRLRRENGDSRINAKRTAAQEGARKAIADLAAAAGIEIPGLQEGEAPTVEQLAGQVQGVTGERDAARVEAEVVRAAWEAQLDPSKLEYLQFKLGRDTAFRELDPAAPDFGAKLRASLAAQVAADPTLKLAGTAVASGVESLGGSNGSDTITPERFARMSMAERSELYRTDKATYDRLAGNAS